MTVKKLWSNVIDVAVSALKRFMRFARLVKVLVQLGKLPSVARLIPFVAWTVLQSRAAM